VTEPATIAHEAHGPGEVWGVRSEESGDGAAAYANALRTQKCNHIPTCCSAASRSRHGRRIACKDGPVAHGPVWDWKTAEIWGHISRQ
jgi:phosphoadenosine phosphosulfate reductase